MHAGYTAYLSSFCLAVHAAGGGGGVVFPLSRFLSAILALLVLTLQPLLCYVVVFVHGDLVAGDDGGVLSSLHGCGLLLVCLISPSLACYPPLNVIVPPLFLWWSLLIP